MKSVVGIVVRAGRAMTDPLSLCVRMGLMVGLTQGLAVLLWHVGYGEVRPADSEVVGLALLLAAFSTLLVAGAAIGLAGFARAGVLGPAAAISVVVGLIISAWLAATGQSGLAAIVGAVAGVTVGMAWCLWCGSRRRGVAPDAFTGFFIVVLLVIAVAASAAVMAIKGTVAEAVGLGPVRLAPVRLGLLFGALLPAAATLFFFWRARHEPDGQQHSWSGVVVGVRLSPGAEDVVAPYAADPHRVDVRRGGNVVSAFTRSAALEGATAGAIVGAVAALAAMAAVVVLVPPARVGCGLLLGCAWMPLAAAVMGTLVGCGLAAAGGHVMRRRILTVGGPACSGPAVPGAEVVMTGNVVQVTDGTGQTVMWFVEQVARVAPEMSAAAETSSAGGQS